MGSWLLLVVLTPCLLQPVSCAVSYQIGIRDPVTQNVKAVQSVRDFVAPAIRTCMGKSLAPKLCDSNIVLPATRLGAGRIIVSLERSNFQLIFALPRVRRFVCSPSSLKSHPASV